MMLSSQAVGQRPVQPVAYTPTFGKDEVINWFRNAPGSTRIDTMCCLLNCCLPFEIRLIGTVLETFGRKEFHQLREMTDRANKPGRRGTGKTLDECVATFYESIKGKDDDIRRGSSAVSQNSNTSAASSTSSTTTNVNAPTINANPQTHLNPNFTAKPLTSHQLQPQPLSSVVAQETSQSNRPIAAHKTEPMRSLQVYEPPQLRQQIQRNHSPAVAAPTPIPQPIVNGIGTGKRSNCSSEDENESSTKDYRVLENKVTRQKIILYLSLLSSTNHEAALVYYSLISQVNKTVGDSDWMEQESEATLEEVTLLYTIGIHHPAFSYEQRLMLSEILVKVRRELQRKKSQAYAQQVFSPVQGFESQYPHHGQQLYFHIPSSMTPPHLHSSLPSLEHIGTPPPQLPAQGSSGGPQGIPNALTRPVPLVDTSRLPPAPQISYYQTLPFPPYPGMQGMGTSTHPQNPAYISAPPLVTNVGQLSGAIRSSSPNNIPAPAHGNDAGAVPPSAKVEKLPPPLYEKIPAPSLEPAPNFPVSRPEKVSCFNCGHQGHSGVECELASIEQMSHHLFRLKYEDNNNKNANN